MENNYSHDLNYVEAFNKAFETYSNPKLPKFSVSELVVVLYDLEVEIIKLKAQRDAVHMIINEKR
jgi:hypothetical protein